MPELSLFDPTDQDGQGPFEEFMTVSELSDMVKEQIEEVFSEIAVRGEASGVSRPKSGHVYFKLKDDGAVMDAVIWRGLSRTLPFELNDGLLIEVKGRLEVYKPQGKYQLIVESIEPKGTGALELAFRQRFQRLKAEGLFDRKRPLPLYPRKIVIVTSPTGAAVRDIVRVLTKRWGYCDLLIIPVKVQGQGAAEEIAEGLFKANQIPSADLIITGRGGGSLEDLWAFNEEIVARAIYASQLPVISAVGHETDFTIADYVADRRAATPTEASVICSPDGQEIIAALLDQKSRLARSLTRLANQTKRDLDQKRDRLQLAIRNLVPRAKSQLDAYSVRARHALKLNLERKKNQVDRVIARLDALNPLAVLARGYSITQHDRDQSVIYRADQAQPGDLIKTRTSSGTIISRVESIAPALDQETSLKIQPRQKV